MENVRVFDTDSFFEAANKIFYYFELNQNCTISGFITDDQGEVVSKGEMVLKVLEELDIKENTQESAGRRRRKRAILNNTIGGYVAQKIFRYKRTIVDNQVKIGIWRLQ